MKVMIVVLALAISAPAFSSAFPSGIGRAEKRTTVSKPAPAPKAPAPAPRKK